MDDLRELDARCAELLGWTYHEELKAPNGATCRQAWLEPNKKFIEWEVPGYSSEPAACAEMDGEARAQGFTLYLWYDRHDVWVACYLREGEQPNWLIWQFGDTEWEARTKAFIAAKERTARAAVRALEQEKGEGKNE